MAWTKKIKKTAGKVSTAAKKRYGIGKGRGGFKFTQVAKDLEMIKSRLNVEKNFKEAATNQFSCGASIGNGPGFYGNIVNTVNLPQGDGQGQRIGLGVKATGMNIKLNMRGQINATKRRVKIQLVRCHNTSLGSATLAGQMYDVNPMTGNVDYFSQRKYQTGKQHSFEILRTVHKTIVPHIDSSTGFADANIGVKLNDLLRFDSDADDYPDDIRYHLFIFVDYGNASVSTASTNTGHIEQGSSTGIFGNWYARMWYVDN